MRASFGVKLVMADLNEGNQPHRANRVNKISMASVLANDVSNYDPQNANSSALEDKLPLQVLIQVKGKIRTNCEKRSNFEEISLKL